MIAIIKDFKHGPIPQSKVFEHLKNGGLKLMCGDVQYAWFPGNKIELVYVSLKGEMESKIIDNVYPSPYVMFHESDEFPNPLPYGPWYFGYLKEIDD